MTAATLGVELFVNGEWADISEDVRQDGVSIERRDGDTLSMSMNLRNSDGKYSPRNVRSPLYGLISNNTPIRCWTELGAARLVQDAGGQWYCADAADLDATADLDLRVDVAMRSWRPAAATYIGLYRGLAYGLWINTDGYLKLTWWEDDSTSHTLTSGIPVPGGVTGRRVLRAVLDGDNGDTTDPKATATFYYSTALDGTWTQLGAVIEHTDTATHNATDSTLGSFTNDSAELFGLELRVDGTLVASLYPGDEATGTTSLTDDQGNDWAPAGTRSVLTNRHYQAVAEVTEWPQEWGEKGAPQAYSPIVCAGQRRRLARGSSPVRSPLRRAIGALTTLAGYWALEDGQDAQSFTPVLGTGKGRIVGDVTPASYDGFAASDPLPVFTTGRAYFPLRPTTPSGSVQFRALMHIPEDVADDAILARFGTSSTMAYCDVRFDLATGGIYVELYNPQGVLGHTSSVLSVDMVGKDMRISVELDQDGADIDVGVVCIEEGADVGYYVTSTKTGMTIGAPTYVWLNPTSADLKSTAFGHLTVENQITSLFDVAQEFAAFIGERADTRLLRLAAENGVSLAVFGVGGACERMGAQKSGQLLDLLDEAGDTDDGLLYEAREDNAFRYRTLESLWSQDAKVTLPWGDGSLLTGRPTDDDSGRANVVTVTRRGGGEYTREVTTGPLSTSPPPSGVGRYEDSYTLSLYSDRAARQQAGWKAHLGTVDEARWQTIAIDLAHPDLQDDPELTRDLLRLEIGDRLDVTGLPSWLPQDDVRLLITGIRVTIAAKAIDDRWRYRIEFLTVPYRPFNVGVWTASQYQVETTTEETTVPGGSPNTPTHLTVNGVSYTVTGINTSRGTNALILYSTPVGGATGTNAFGYELAVDLNGSGQFVVTGEGANQNVPSTGTGFVISGHGTNADALVPRSVGDVVVLLDSGNASTPWPNNYPDTTETTTTTTQTPIPAGVTAGRWGSGLSILDSSIGSTDTTMDVLVVRGPQWTTRAVDFPLLVKMNGEVIRVTDIGDPVSGVQEFTIERGVNGFQRAHEAGTVGPVVELAEPAYWGGRSRGGAGFSGGGDTGGGDTGSGGDTETPNTVRIGTATYPLSGIDPGTATGWGGDPAYPGDRGVDQLIVYTAAYGAATDTNQWGAEAPADSDYLVNSVNDRQVSGSTTGTSIPSGGIVLSGHGAARSFILANATVGALIELIYVAPSTGGGGTGGGGTGGGTTGVGPDFSVCEYVMTYSSNSNTIPGLISAGKVNEIRLAFAFDQSGVLKMASNNYVAAWASDIASFRAAGGRVVVSLGGAGNSIDTSSTSAVVNEFIALASACGFVPDDLDWDIESGSSFPTTAARAINAGLVAHYGPNFGITMAPNGSNVGAYLPAAVQFHQDGHLRWYAQQFYDYPNPNYNDVLSRINEALNAGIPASKLGVGFALTSPVSNGFWTNANALSAMQQIRAAKGVRRAYLWESQVSGASTWASNMRSAVE